MTIDTESKTRFHQNKMDYGYPGLKMTAELILPYIPNHKRYVEPFAGLGRVASLVQTKDIILNDMSDYAVKELKQTFPNAIITQEQYKECIKRWDSEDTFFLIDCPWYRDIYGTKDYIFYDRTPLEYFEDLLSFLPSIKGNWIVCGDKWEHDYRRACTKSPYPNLILKSDKGLWHGKYGVMLTSNKDFTRNILYNV